MNIDVDITSKFFKGFADATRLSILLSLLEKPQTVSEIVTITGLSQSNVSNHLKCLDGCGIVLAKRAGKYMYYAIRDEQTKQLLSVSQDIIKPVNSNIACCPENERLEIT